MGIARSNYAMGNLAFSGARDKQEREACTCVTGGARSPERELQLAKPSSQEEKQHLRACCGSGSSHLVDAQGLFLVAAEQAVACCNARARLAQRLEACGDAGGTAAAPQRAAQDMSLSSSDAERSVATRVH